MNSSPPNGLARDDEEDNYSGGGRRGGSGWLMDKGGGPSWRWLVSILLATIGAGLAWWMTAIWSIATDTREAVIGLRSDVGIIAGKVAEQHEAQEKLWNKWSTDHELLLKDDYKLDIDHDWISAQVHANEAVREVGPAIHGERPRQK